MESEERKQLLLELLEKRVDMPGLIADVLEQVLEPALDDVVADSENKFDDMAKAALYPALKPLLLSYVSELWGKVDGK